MKRGVTTREKETEASFNFLKWFQRTQKNTTFERRGKKLTDQKHIFQHEQRTSRTHTIFQEHYLAAFRTSKISITAKFNFPSFFLFTHLRSFFSVAVVFVSCSVTHSKLFFFVFYSFLFAMMDGCRVWRWWFLYYVLKFPYYYVFCKSIFMCTFCIKLPIYISVVRLILLPALARSFIHCTIFFPRKRWCAYNSGVCIHVSVYIFQYHLHSTIHIFFSQVGFSFFGFTEFAHNILLKQRRRQRLETNNHFAQYGR